MEAVVGASWLLAWKLLTERLLGPGPPLYLARTLLVPTPCAWEPLAGFPPRWLTAVQAGCQGSATRGR